MNTVDKAIDVVLQHEGGLTTDHAGATNYGISLRTAIAEGDRNADGVLDFDLDLDGDVDAEDIKAMSEERAREYYADCFTRYGLTGVHHDAIAIKWFDLAVNMGMRQATRIVQRASRAAGTPVVDDGYIGPRTLGAVNRAQTSQLLVAIRSEAAGFYRSLVVKNRGLYGPFLAGWLNRAYA